MARFTFDTGFMAKAQTWTPTNNINPLPAWKFMNQSGTLGTFLAGSAVYVGGTGRVKVIPAGTVAPFTISKFDALNNGGIQYTTNNGLITTGGSGTGLTVDITAAGGATQNILTIAVNNPGSGYQNGDIIEVVENGQGGIDQARYRLEFSAGVPTAADAVEFIGAQAGSILPILVDYVLVPSTGAATDLIVGR